MLTMERCYCPQPHYPEGVICRWLTPVEVAPDAVRAYIICNRCAAGRCSEQPAAPRGRHPDPDHKEDPVAG